MKICIINHVNSLNLGDCALLYSTIEIVNRALKPERISVFSFNKRYDKNLKLPSNVEIIESPCREALNIIDRLNILKNMVLTLLWALVFRMTRKDILKNKATDRLKGADLVIVRGGDNLGDTYGLNSIIQHLYNIVISILANKKIVIFGTTIGPFKNRLLKYLILKILTKVNCVIVRDRFSKNILINNGKVSPKKIFLMPDVAFLLPQIKDKKYDNVISDKKIKIGIVPSTLILKYLKKGEGYDLYTRTINWIIDNYNSEIIMIPHVLSPTIGDVKFTRALLTKVRNKNDIKIIYETDPKKIKYVISKLNLLISPRMHPIIHALSVGTPVIGIDYNFKTIEIMREFGLEEYVLRVDELNFQNMQNLIKKTVPKLDKITKQIKKIKKIKLEKASKYEDVLKQIFSDLKCRK